MKGITLKLKKSILFYYSLMEFPINIALFPVVVFIPKYYTGDLGLSLVIVANIILGVRIFDVITDPLCGFLNDKTVTRWGRRKPWIAVATPLMMLSIYMLFLPPIDAGPLHLFTWMMLLSLATTMIIIPYYAWGSELSPDYNERTKITGWRAMAGALGSLSAQLIPSFALLFWGIGGSGNVLNLVGTAMVILMPICAICTISFVPESKNYIRSSISPIKGMKLMAENKPFQRLIIAFMIGGIAASITTPLYLFFITYVLDAEDMAIYMLTVFYLSSIAAVPFWVWLSTHIGKHRSYVMGLSLIALAHPFYLLLGEGDFWWMLPITVITGFSAGSFYSLPNSMKADVIDLDTLKSGENRSAIFFSTWSFTLKMTASLGTWIALTSLAWVGFDASPNGYNDPDQLFGLRLLFSTIPSVFYFIAMAIIWNYPITEAKHLEMREELETRNLSRSN